MLTASGRIGRAAFAAGLLALVALWSLGRWGLEPVAPGWAMTVLALCLLYPATCMVNQRLHDLGRSGWWAGLLLLALFVAARLPGTMASQAALILTGGALFLLALMPGSPGHNRYGPVPRPVRAGSVPHPR